MSRTIRHNRKPCRAVARFDWRGNPYIRPAVPARVADGKVFDMSKEATWMRRITLRTWKAKVKTALLQGRELPPEPKTGGWQSW